MEIKYPPVAIHLLDAFHLQLQPSAVAAHSDSTSFCHAAMAFDDACHTHGAGGILDICTALARRTAKALHATADLGAVLPAGN